jgi:hypothetical protein
MKSFFSVNSVRRMMKSRSYFSKYSRKNSAVA